MTYPPFKQQRLPAIILSQSSGRNKRSDHIRKRFCFNFCADFCLPYSTPSALNTASSIENFYFWNSEALFRNFVGLYSNYSKHLHLSLEYAMMESRDRVLRLNHLSYRLYSLAALGFSRSGFFNGVVLAYERSDGNSLCNGSRRRQAQHRLIRPNRLLC